MLFSTVDIQEPVDDDVHQSENIDFEHEVEREGLMYVGGYIASEFRQYEFLWTKTQGDDSGWITFVARENKS